MVASTVAAAVDERTPLRNNRTRRRAPYLTGIADGDEEELAREQRLARASRKTEEEVVFGKWPWRLLNTHVSNILVSLILGSLICPSLLQSQWWWWKLEPMICCCYYADESDSESEETYGNNI